MSDASAASCGDKVVVGEGGGLVVGGTDDELAVGIETVVVEAVSPLVTSLFLATTPISATTPPATISNANTTSSVDNRLRELRG